MRRASRIVVYHALYLQIINPDCRILRRRYDRSHKKELDKVIISRCKNRAKSKNLEFDLTIEWVREQLKKGICKISGRSFDLTAEGNPTINSPSVDRIDSSKGYTMDNCRMVVWGWNMACGPWGEEALINLFKDVLKTTHQDKNF